MKNTYFITGISTDVGKTIVSAIFTETLQADYWKPVQAGELSNSDMHKVQRLTSNSKSVFHKSAYLLNTPASPHLAAEIDGVHIDLQQLKRPNVKNNLIIEGAGGLLVPLNSTQTIADLIEPTDRIIVVSRHYLGSINHTLLTCEALKQRGLSVFGMVFSGEKNTASEEIILQKTQPKMSFRIEEEPYFDKNVILYYAEKLQL